ncbi:hypothetical protein BJ170DRAFT_406876 [Xylariales sp. AK1849]|nr:hypothetical protein BJ170DRAFT_406876 [Xylariales sp. AK1849]
MSILSVPDTGLQLESSDSSDFLPMQAFGITLNDNVIEDMIKCVQNGQKIELFLGNNPSFQYGDEEEPIKPTPDLFDYDLYLSNLNETTTKAQRLPNPAMSILKKPSDAKAKPSIRVERVTSGTKKGGKATKPKPKSAMAMALSNAGTARSLPSSPALNGVASPSHNPASAATQQLIEKNKGLRSTIVHELAVRDQSYEYLKERWTGSEADLKTTLSKVADHIDTKWSMKKLYWKDLDVWNYNYSPSENRQLAVENAKKQYDKQRLGTTAPEWERLLKEEDRGKGIVLSKLQATLAKGNITPVPRAPKPEDGSKNSSDESVKGKAGGEAMARSNSQPMGSKPKPKVSDREAQSKSLFSNKPAKKTAAATKTVTQANKVKVAEKNNNKRILSAEFVQDSSSDDEAPLIASTTTKPKPAEKSWEKSIERLAEKVVAKPERSSAPPIKKEKSPAPPLKKERSPALAVKDERSPVPAVKKERSPAPVAAKPKPKSAIRAPRPATSKAPTPSTTQKRPREEEDSSSSSGAPLSKRFKHPKEATKALPSTTTTSLKHRPSDASQNSRGTPSNLSMKSKNTSPAKSSPLASSPPTNASEFDDNHNNQPQQQHYQAPRTNGIYTNGTNGVSAKKRPMRDADAMPPAKKPRVSKEILAQARRFDIFYEKYKSLHNDLTKMANPPQKDLTDLLDMRQRLVNLKAEIRREVDPAA